MHRRLLVSTITAGLVLGMPAAAWASEDPGTSAEATGASVEGVVVISHAEASDGEASTTGLELFGEHVTGTSQEGPGTSEDAVFDSERDAGIDSEQAHVQVGASSSTVHEDGSSEAHSDLVVVDVGNGTLRAELLSADAYSNGDAQSDGVKLTSSQDPTGEGITVLHSEVSGGDGSAAIAIIGGEGILTDEQTGGLCATEIVVVGADIVCVKATEAGTSSGVVDDLGPAGGDPIAGIVTSSNGPAEASPLPAADQPSVLASTPPPTGLPRTGMDLLGLLIVAAGAVGSGEQLRRRGMTVA